MPSNLCNLKGQAKLYYNMSCIHVWSLLSDTFGVPSKDGLNLSYYQTYQSRLKYQRLVYMRSGAMGKGESFLPKW